MDSNNELHTALQSIRKLEDRFNHRFHYPWTFLNDEPFTPEFITLTTSLASGPVTHSLIPPSHWSIPSHINRTAMESNMRSLEDNDIIYGGSLSYRHMCRFNSGFFMHQPALQDFEWYWRVEPDIDFTCDISYDPFTFLRTNQKVYGFVMSLYEIPATVPSLWNHTKEFFSLHPELLEKNNAFPLISDSKTPLDEASFNLCHFWSNFEIASLSFFRSPAYTAFFEHLDSQGGFFYERWGDAPVHTLALALMVDKAKIHHFADMGYRHSHAERCPQDAGSHESGRCVCDRGRNYDRAGDSCMPRWFGMSGVGVGGRWESREERRERLERKRRRRKKKKEKEMREKAEGEKV